MIGRYKRTGGQRESGGDTVKGQRGGNEVDEVMERKQEIQTKMDGIDILHRLYTYTFIYNNILRF